MTHPYQDAANPIETRVDDLLSRMTASEKAAQLSQYFYFGTMGSDSASTDDAMPEEGRDFGSQAAAVEKALQTCGVGSLLFVRDAATANRLQRMAIEGSRLGIPLVFGYDVIHGLRTVFPVPIATAASWEPGVAEAGQRVAAREARAVGIHWSFAPMVDIAQDPRWGRIIEGAGEDPVLGAAMAAAQVRGFQGTESHFGAEAVLACPKHFAGYGAARGGRDYEDAEISDNELFNVYFPPFQAAIEAGAATVMGAYMDLNGVPASGNSWLLTDVLREQMGFEGFVVSDANAVRSLETQHFAADQADAAVRALNAGLDMEMTMADPAFGNLADAVEQGTVSMATLDAAVRRVLHAKFALGLFESPYVDEASEETVLAAEEHRDVAQLAAEKSLVLLKNDSTLPLTAPGSVAVIGQLADSKRDTLGPWIFGYDIDETVTILDGLKARLPQVEFAPGVAIPERKFGSMFDAMDAVVARTPAEYDDDVAVAQAVDLAARSDVAIVVVGQRQNQIGEAASTDTLELPGRQLEQLKAIHATGTPVVVLVMSARPLDLRWAEENVAAIMQVWYPGTRGGSAVAAALVGDVSPAGRLPFTWPRHVGQVPMVYNHYRTFQPENQGQRYWGEPSTPLYSFGHGLSYATFEYSNLKLDRDEIPVGATLKVSVDVTNTSKCDGDEVVQLYIHQRHGTSSQPVRELKAFERIAIAAGETRTVEFELGPKQLSYWSAATRNWVQDATVLDVWVGGSSEASLGNGVVTS